MKNLSSVGRHEHNRIAGAQLGMGSPHDRPQPPSAETEPTRGSESREFCTCSIVRMLARGGVLSGGSTFVCDAHVAAALTNELSPRASAVA
jgi:hypothetical protein